MPFGIGRFLGRNAGTIGGLAGSAFGPVGGMVGGAIGSAIQSERRAGAMSAPSFSPESYDPTQGLGLGQMRQQQQNRNLEAEALSQIMPTAQGPAAYLQSAAIQGAGRASARLAQEGAEREQQRLASQALQGRVGLEQQQQQTIQNLAGMEMQGKQFGIQQAFAERQAEREFQQARSDAALGFAATLLTSPLGNTALGKIAGKGKLNIKGFGGKAIGFLRGLGSGSGATAQSTGRNINNFDPGAWQPAASRPYSGYGGTYSTNTSDR